jgi:hypothetical protein
MFGILKGRATRLSWHKLCSPPAPPMIWEQSVDCSFVISNQHSACH